MRRIGGQNLYREVPDNELIDRAKSDRDAFEAFCRRHLPAVIAYFARATGRRDVALDLAQETFAAVTLALPAYELTDAPGTAWLFSIARHRLADYQRKGQVEHSLRERLEMQPITLDHEGDKIVQRMIKDADNAGVLDAVDRLPDEHRRVISSRFIQEQSYAEIAAQLQCSEQVARKRVSRALEALRRRLVASDA